MKYYYIVKFVFSVFLFVILSVGAASAQVPSITSFMPAEGALGMPVPLTYNIILDNHFLAFGELTT